MYRDENERLHTLQIKQTHKILIVDDDRSLADALGKALETDGHEVHLAYDGAGGREMYFAIQPTVILLDLALPHVSGIEVGKVIRETSTEKNNLLLAVTGWNHDEDRRRTRRIGFNGYFTKPVDLELLRKRVFEFQAGAAEVDRDRTVV